ncbi:enoyl-CoA hydratase/isomerase family protein [Nocardia sp. NEAU-351]|uniref:Enoyl-CoA hydratase/isomerase family protein n=1 Tax=Nocardia bovistercoris TaxID=2785916 RepID=A0A931II09_9NOCA|nr:enoyl-CoA hydratase/isomerase family protein [Nocardia bovistercoris]
MLLTRDEDGVRTLTLNRPHRKNAIDAELWAALADALREVATDRSVRALVITGAGGAFCSGADISVPDNAHPIYRMRALTDVAALLYELPLPTIASVTGVAVGAGWNLALGCDLVVAAAEASFSQIFAKRGLSMDLGGSWLLPRLVGLQQAKRLAMLAETLDAAQAHALGLVTWVVPGAEIDAFTADLAARLAAGPPVALAQIKALLNDGSASTHREALAAEARAQGLNFATADAKEAFAAFAARREPTYTGRWLIERPPIRSADGRRAGDAPSTASATSGHDGALSGGNAVSNDTGR